MPAEGPEDLLEPVTTEPYIGKVGLVGTGETRGRPVGRRRGQQRGADPVLQLDIAAAFGREVGTHGLEAKPTFCRRCVGVGYQGQYEFGKELSPLERANTSSIEESVQSLKVGD